MPITRTPWIDDDGSGTTGTIINNAEKTTLYNQIDNYVAGSWTDIAFNAAAFTASAGTWTVNAAALVTWRYAVIAGTTAHFILDITGGAQTISASTIFLYITLPAGVPLSTKQQSTPLIYYGPGGFGTGLLQMVPGAARLELLRDIAGTAWGVQSGGLFFRAAWFCSIV